MSLAFVACVERGALEDQTKLLCRSVRRFAGRFRNANIYTFQPRRGTEISQATRDVLSGLGVVHNDELLNDDYHDYAFGNKIFASAWAEEALDEEILVFLDSDTIFTREPIELDLPDGIDFAARVVSRSKYGSTGPGHPNEDYWSTLFQICDTHCEWFVETIFDRESIRPYFNSGLVAVRRSAGLFRRWRANFVRLLQAGHISPLTGMAGMDELSLAATLACAAERRVRILDARYNYPLELTQRPLLDSPLREAQLDDLVHVHYRYHFSEPGHLRRIHPPLDPNSPVVRWLEQYLPLKPLDPRVGASRGESAQS